MLSQNMSQLEKRVSNDVFLNILLIDSLSHAESVIILGWSVIPTSLPKFQRQAKPEFGAYPFTSN